MPATPPLYRRLACTAPCVMNARLCIYCRTTQIIQLVYGLPINMVHGHFITPLLYELGVIGGALCTALVSPERTPVIGASGGVYALFGIHVADLALNWTEYKDVTILNRWIRGGVIGLLMILDLLVYLFDYNEQTSYSTHFGGFLTGVLIGTIFLHNLEVRNSKRCCACACGAGRGRGRG